MSEQLIQIKRGLKSQLDNYGAMQSGELGFCTDTGEVYVGTGSANVFVGKALLGDSCPTTHNKGRFYYVTEGPNAGYLYLDDGTTWQRVNALKLTDVVGTLKDIPGTLDDIKDGPNYSKVLTADVTNGHVNKVSDGVYTKDAKEIATHIDEPTIHRKINDTAEGNTDLWSAQKIKTEIFNAIKGMDWQDSVKTMQLATPPSSPAVKDRYLIPIGAEREWEGKSGQIAEWDGTKWLFYAPQIGFALYVEDLNKNYTYNKSGEWVPTGGANQTIEAGKGLVGGGSNDNVTIDVNAGDGIEVVNDAVTVKAAAGITVNATGVSVKAANGISIDASGVAVKAYNGITVDSNGVAVNIDGDSIKYDAANSNRLVVYHIDGGSFTR